MRELLLVRHAKSSWTTGAASDLERPLNARGLDDAPAMGAWLGQHGYRPSFVVTSPALRARMTAERLLAGMEAEEVPVEDDPRIYGGGLRELVAVLEAHDRHPGRGMLVGHNPGLDELVLWLAAAPPPYSKTGKLMTTCAVARVTPAAPGSLLGPRCGRIEGIFRPREVL